MDEYWQKWNPVMQQWVPSLGPENDRRGYYRSMVQKRRWYLHGRYCYHTAITSKDVDNLSHPLLRTPMQQNDADAATIGDYLKQLLLDVWKYDEGFNGKRPFGNSGWKTEIYGAMVKNAWVQGVWDYEDNWLSYISQEEEDKADKLILDAIQSL